MIQDPSLQQHWQQSTYEPGPKQILGEDTFGPVNERFAVTKRGTWRL